MLNDSIHNEYTLEFHNITFFLFNHSDMKIIELTDYIVHYYIYNINDFLKIALKCIKYLDI